MTEVKLRVRERLLVEADGMRTSGESVFCPVRSGTVSTEACKNCVHAHAVTSESVVCTPGFALPTGVDAPAGSAVASPWTLVRADVPGVALVPLARATPSHLLPVIDEDDRFLGFVSPSILENPRWPWHRIAVTLARDVAAGSALVVSESAPLAHALRLMARRGSRALALVDPSWALRGVLSDVDALRALVRPAEMGRREPGQR